MNELFFVINILNLVPCLDIEKSSIDIIKNLTSRTNQTTAIKYVPHSLEGHHIVRMKESM